MTLHYIVHNVVFQLLYAFFINKLKIFKKWNMIMYFLLCACHLTASLYNGLLHQELLYHTSWVFRKQKEGFFESVGAYSRIRLIVMRLFSKNNVAYRLYIYQVLLKRGHVRGCNNSLPFYFWVTRGRRWIDPSQHLTSIELRSVEFEERV